MAKQPRPLVGKVAAITGGARGIGRATAEAFVRKGMKVAIGDLDLELAAQDRRASSAAGPSPTSSTSPSASPSSGSSTRSSASSARSTSSSTTPGSCRSARSSPRTTLSARRQVDINVHGVLYGMKLVLPRFLERGSGHLVNIASTAGKGGFPGVATYCGTKHFVVGVSEAVRAELHETPVEVSCVMPGHRQHRADLRRPAGAPGQERRARARSPTRSSRRSRARASTSSCPRMIGPINKVMGVLPRAGREGIARALKADKVMVDVRPERPARLRAARGELRARPRARARSPSSSPRVRRARPQPLGDPRARSPRPRPPGGSARRRRSPRAPGGRAPRPSAGRSPAG